MIFNIDPPLHPSQEGICGIHFFEFPGFTTLKTGTNKK